MCNKENYFTTKVLAYKIHSGNLCKIITAYNESEMADLNLGSRTGEVKPFVEAYAAKFDQKTGNNFEKTVLHKIRTEQCVMFLQHWTDDESLVLSGQGYFVVKDKNLEPIIGATTVSDAWTKWIENFKLQMKTKHFDQPRE